MTGQSTDQPTLGVCYYPEHWPESMWERDAREMKEAGITHVRVGEFAWSRFEPEPGVYDFSWLERAVAVLASHGLKIVMGTPTATPPKWLDHRDLHSFPTRRSSDLPGGHNMADG